MGVGLWVPRLSRRQRGGLVFASVALAVTLIAVLFVVGPMATERTGLRRQVFPDVGFRGAPVLSDVAADIALDFLDVDPVLPRRFFSVRWTGFWYVSEAVEVELHAAGDDRLDVWLDGELVIRRQPPADMHTLVRRVRLDAGIHELRAEYEQHGGAFNLQLEWSPVAGEPRPLPAAMLFPQRPDERELQLARTDAVLRSVVPVVWLFPLGIVLVILARPLASHISARSAYDWCRARRTNVAFACVVGLMSLSAAIARIPGWNPETLWDDDVIYGSLIRGQHLYDLITTPVHAAPGLFPVWRAFYEVFPDPEWSLQILPFACGIAAIPVMALLGRRLTGSAALGVLAGALTALNPLLAYYTVAVHGYSFEFLLTALFLSGAVALAGGIEPRRFGWIALGGGVAAFFSAASLLVSFPIVHLGALFAIASEKRPQHKVLLWAAAYNVMAVAAVLFLQRRVNAAVTEDFSGGFMPLDSPAASLGFLANAGRQAVEMSMPNWTGQGTAHFSLPDTVSWPLPLMVVGLIWLLERRQYRFVGLALGGIYAAVVVASGLELYPLGAGRTDIFTFPVGILLFTAGVWCVTDALRRSSAIRLFAAALAVALAVSHPVPVTYRDRNDARLVENLAGNIQSDDWIMLSFSAGYLAAFYGPWDVDLIPHDTSTGFVATVVRDKVLHLPLRLDYGSPDVDKHTAASVEHRRIVRDFLEGQRPARIWLLAWHATTFHGQDWMPNILSVLVDDGYRVERVQDATRGALYLAVNPGSSAHTQ